ncbi:MAG: phosphatase PAP2 family protein [Longimicrobiales bacterium]|nr:phosphatase PAP2 family protein [Longimicrobiales bacterium]
MTPILIRLERWDEQLLLALVARRRPLLDRFMHAVTHLADWPVAVALTLTVRLAAPPPLHAAGVRMVWTLALSHLAVEILKRVFTRERPTLPVGLGWLIHAPDRFSFPSGHATAALSMALPLALALPGAAGALFLVVGLMVGVSRCYLGVHYPGDVLAGWSLSATVLAAGLLLGL